MDETTGDRLDSHGSNDVAVSPTPGFTTGKIGNASTYDGTGQSVFIDPAGTGLDGTGNFTVAGWFNVDVVDTVFQTFVARSDHDTSSQSAIDWALQIKGTSDIPTFSIRVGSTSYEVDWSGAISVGTWYFLAAYYSDDDDEIGISLNGGAFLTAATAGIINTGGNSFRFGRASWTDDWGGFYDGSLDEWGYWKDRLLTQADVGFLYNSDNGRAYGDL